MQTQKGTLSLVENVNSLKLSGLCVTAPVNGAQQEVEQTGL